MERPQILLDRATPVAHVHRTQALDTLFSETVALFHQLRAIAEHVHQQGDTTAGKRTTLRDLDRLGPQTVPYMARARAISRQHVQALVNELAHEALVELVDNPAHKRSRLVQLTPRGKHVVDEMNRREAALLAQLEIPISEHEVRTAAEVLRGIRTVLARAASSQLLAAPPGD